MIFNFFFSVPPQKPKIIDERGKEVQSRAGPYEEGGDMTLTCFVTGGKCFLNLNNNVNAYKQVDLKK